MPSPLIPPGQASGNPVRISPARAAAFSILNSIATTSAHSDDLLHSPAMSELSQPDRNLATTLVLGVLRWQIALDARMQPLLQRPDLALPAPVANALRIGAFQILHLDRIPAHAALSESVELTRFAGHPHAAGMVNAILRQLTRQPSPRPPIFETTPALARRLAHPEWLVNRWVRTYGRSATLAICTHDQQPPAVPSLFSVLPAADDDPPGATLPNIDDGSRLVAELAAASHPAPLRIWDCCAAPGGKTLILAHRHPAAAILASDTNPRRLQSLSDRLHSAAPHVRTLHADATLLPSSEGLFDLILCDVPCTGTGTLSRNPEIKQRLQPSDIGRQATRQRQILSSALSRLAPGGHLLYSTCSLEPEENEAVVANVLTTVPSAVTAASLDSTLQQLADTGILPCTPPPNLLRDGHLRTLPGVSLNADGFFAALFHHT